MLPSDYRCPRCHCQACYALHRKGFDWVMSLFGLRPARCLTCGKRFYARYSVARSERDSGTATKKPSEKTRSGPIAKGEPEHGRKIHSGSKSEKAA